MTRKTTAPAAERPRTPINIRADIAKLKADKAAAEADLGKLQAQRPTLLLDVSELGDARLDAHDTAAAKASRVIERAAARLAQLEVELADTIVVEKAAALQVIVDRGQAAAAAYRELVQEQYAPIAVELAAVLKAMAEQLAVVDDANRHIAYVDRINANAFRDPVYDPGTRPPAQIREIYWLDGSGEECRPQIVNKQFMVANTTQHERMIPNPAYLTWKPWPKEFAPSIVEAARIPAATAESQLLFNGRDR